MTLRMHVSSLKTPWDRFIKKVCKGCDKHDHSKGCWIWTASKTGPGYGKFNLNGFIIDAHRMAFYFAHGKWPRYNALHTCNVRACVNINHLYDGTSSDNMYDRYKR